MLMHSHKTPNPTKAGRMYGTFVPSELGVIRVLQNDGRVTKVHMPRKQRRLIIRSSLKERRRNGIA